MGRSRGGLTTKIHALVDGDCRPLTLLLTGGQAGDNPMLAPLLDAVGDAAPSRFRLLADKAYSHPRTRTMLRQRRIAHTIPERSDQIAHRKRQGSRGGRPPGFDPDAYRKRNAVERTFSRFKQWRGIATRYDKYAHTYRGGVLLAAITINARLALSDTP